MKRGYTLVNTLLGLFIVILIMQISSLLLRILVNHQTPRIRQNEIFELQITQLFVRTNQIECTSDILTIDEFDIQFDRNRIVKRPGYEILLQDVETLEFTCDGPIIMTYQYQGDHYEFAFEKSAR